MNLPEPHERRRLARAMWAYSGMGQKDLAARAGIEYNRLRAALGNDLRKSPPSTDELLRLATATGVPREFAIEGWGAITGVEARIAAIEARLDGITERRPSDRDASLVQARQLREEEPGDEAPGERRRRRA